jgi:hydroxymethylglutaryl-CoA lyase
MRSTESSAVRSTEALRAYRAGSGSLPFSLPARVQIQEVAPRDGLQLEKRVLATAEKVALVDALSATGVDGVQVTSFVHPKAVPQLADAESVMAAIDRAPDVTYSVLVPNLAGARRAVPFRADVWELMLSVTDAHSIANANRTTAAALEAMRDVVSLANQHGVRPVGTMATALGCPFEGRVPYERIAWVVESWRDLGVRQVMLADTVGVADPAHVYATCARLAADFPDITLALHLHDTRGLGLANVLAGLAAGVAMFDASTGGIGGCPFAPGATGNIATEDLVHMLGLLGVETGVDLETVRRIARGAVTAAVDHPLESSLSRANPSWILSEPPTRQQLPGGAEEAPHGRKHD